MATTDDQLVTAKGLAQSLGEAAGGGIVELFSGSAGTVTLPQSYDTYKVLFAAARSSTNTGSGVCVPPDSKAQFYDGQRNVSVSFLGSKASAPYGYAITNIYAIP